VKTILVAYDDTQPSRRALERAAMLADALGSRVIVTSIAPLIHSSPRSAATLSHSAGPTHADVERARDMLAERGIAAEIAEGTGEPATAIARLAEEHGVDLVVVGTRELGAIQRLLGQSVSQAVTRRVHCDVLIVHPEH
jgi:nucleotide-binding universal stress UspA family protein